VRSSEALAAESFLSLSASSDLFILSLLDKETAIDPCRVTEAGAVDGRTGGEGDSSALKVATPPEVVVVVVVGANDDEVETYGYEPWNDGVTEL
jgi:hypothetical protein